MNPTQIHSPTGVNGSLDLFTGIFYMVRIFGLGQGAVQPSLGISSGSGGDFLEQDIFTEGDPNADSLWYLQDTSSNGFYHWGLKAQSSDIVAWTSGQEIGINYALELKNASNHNSESDSEHEKTLWSLEEHSLGAFGYAETVYKIKPYSFPQGMVTFSSGQKSPNGWYLKLDTEQQAELLNDDETPRQAADSLFVFEPTNFKLYAEIAHLDIGENSDLLKLHHSHVPLTSTRILRNPSGNTTEENVTFGSQIEYELYAQPDLQEFFSGITVISPNTKPSRKYFDFENKNDISERVKGIMPLKATGYVTSSEEFEVEPFSTKKISGYITYITEFQGVSYYSWADVTATVDMMGDNGQVVKDVTVKDTNLLRSLIRSQGYEGVIKMVDTPTTSCAGKQNGDGIPVDEADCATLRIKTTGTIRGSLPIPAIQFEEESTYVPRYEQAFKMREMGHLS